MSAIIRLGLVLREAVATPYRDLVTRSTGVAVRNRVLTVLRDSRDEHAELDFSDIGLVDFSCADEVVAKLLLVTLGLPSPRLVLRGVREDHADAIAQVLAKYDMVVMALLAESRQPRLLGAAPEDWHAAFRALAQLGRAPAPPVAALLEWPLPRATDALGALARKRCVCVHADETYELGAVA